MLARLLIGVVLVLALVSVATANTFEQFGEIHTVKTADGVSIKLLHYCYKGVCNKGAQPIILFSGLMANMNEYLAHTPAELKSKYAPYYPQMAIASWAQNDPNVKADPLLQHSLAYYLWKKGYDVWLVNYRGTGYDTMKSQKGSVYVSLDVWAMYDTPAAINYVYSKTGKNPIIGGHSTGGLVSYVYLQGTKFQSTLSCLTGDPWCKKVASYDSLVKERNGITKGAQTVLGVIALDPAMIPPLPQIIDTKVGWALLDIPIYMDLRSLLESIAKSRLLWNTTLLAMNFLYTVIEEAYYQYGDRCELIKALAMYATEDMNDPLGDFSVRYIMDSIYTPTLVQYADFGLRLTAREYFENGGKSYLISPPNPKPGLDGYYYYIYNMKKVQVPFITILSELPGLVEAEQIEKDLMGRKTPHPLDETWLIKGTGHLELPFGLKAPAEIFPKIGNWLDKMQALYGYTTTPR
ncbi:MAG: hypothetical protein QFX36_01640 [Archaeoglobales archaeon]|nr:hypothetical protein [Archaeoglobales archaeon]